MPKEGKRRRLVPCPLLLLQEAPEVWLAKGQQKPSAPDDGTSGQGDRAICGTFARMEAITYAEVEIGANT
jgi:hypothetical protein